MIGEEGGLIEKIDGLMKKEQAHVHRREGRSGPGEPNLVTGRMASLDGHMEGTRKWRDVRKDLTKDQSEQNHPRNLACVFQN